MASEWGGVLNLTFTPLFPIFSHILLYFTDIGTKADGSCLKHVRALDFVTQKGVSQRTMAKHEETIMTYAKEQDYGI